VSADRPMGVLQKASDLIELLAERGPLTPGDIADHIRMPRPSVYRLVEALSHTRFTVTMPDSRAKVSERWLRLADASRAAMHEWDSARTTLDNLRDVSGQTTFLSVPRDDHAVCVDWAQGRGINVLVLKPGRSLPLYAGAAGRATLAFRVDAARYLQQAPFPSLTRRTLTSANQLRRDIKLTRDRGYSVSDEDVTDGIGALGVPLLDHAGQLRGILSLAGLAEDIRDNQSELVAQLTTAGAALTESLQENLQARPPVGQPTHVTARDAACGPEHHRSP
jgi:IclR family acetate operon transcriptional repressor